MATFSISELAREYRVTTRTIRFYEEKGLLDPARLGSSRVYSNADRVKLRLILRGKRLGLTLQESRDIIAMYDPARGNIQQLEKLINTYRQKREQLQLQLQDLRALIDDLQVAEDKCQQALNLQPDDNRVAESQL